MEGRRKKEGEEEEKLVEEEEEKLVEEEGEEEKLVEEEKLGEEEGRRGDESKKGRGGEWELASKYGKSFLLKKGGKSHDTVPLTRCAEFCLRYICLCRALVTLNV